MKHCAYCGRENIEGATHCNECGTADFKETVTTKSAPRVKNHHAKILIVGIATAVAEVGALYMAAYLKGEGSNFSAFAIFFPIPFLLSIPFLHLWLFAIITMIVQFPVYGYMIGKAWIRGDVWRVGFRILAFHLAFAVISVCSLLVNRT